MLIGFAAQPAAPSHPHPPEYKGQRPSRDRGISHDALWLFPFQLILMSTDL